MEFITAKEARQLTNTPTEAFKWVDGKIRQAAYQGKTIIYLDITDADSKLQEWIFIHRQELKEKLEAQGFVVFNFEQAISPMLRIQICW